MRFSEAVKLLAAPFPVQKAFLRGVPENTAAAASGTPNDAYRMVVLYIGSGQVQEGDAGTEGEENWRARTQIPLGLALPDQWLSTALDMLVELRRPFLYTRHGLRSAREWRLIRHLAGEVCDAMGWSRELRYPDFETLWKELGGGVLDWQGPYNTTGLSEHPPG